jgi:hypothetical protein
MRQGIIAFLVVLAGCVGVFAVLGLGAPPPEAVATPSVTVKLSPEPASKITVLPSRVVVEGRSRIAR